MKYAAENAEATMQHSDQVTILEYRWFENAIPNPILQDDNA